MSANKGIFRRFLERPTRRELLGGMLAWGTLWFADLRPAAAAPRSSDSDNTVAQALVGVDVLPTLDTPRTVNEFLKSMDLTGSASITVDGQTYGTECRATPNSLFQANLLPDLRDGLMLDLVGDLKNNELKVATLAVVQTKEEFPLDATGNTPSFVSADASSRPALFLIGTAASYVSAETGAVLFVTPSPDLLGRANDLNIMEGFYYEDVDRRVGGVNENFTWSFLNLVAEGGRAFRTDALAGRQEYIKYLHGTRPIFFTPR